MSAAARRAGTRDWPPHTRPRHGPEPASAFEGARPQRVFRSGFVSRAISALLTALFVVAAAASGASAAEQVDLLLVLAVDISRSIDSQKFQLQREGYAAAISDPRVLEAIHSGPLGRIGVLYVEWSGVTSQKVVTDWTTIGEANDAREFGDRLLEMPRFFADRTSISAAIDFSMNRLTQSPYEAKRRIIDVSGDGTNNSGSDVGEARDRAVAKGVTINGLVILSATPLSWNPDHTNPPGGLDNYYRNNVIGGPGAFVQVAQGFESFGQAIVKKLIAEVAQSGSMPQRQAAAVRSQQGVR